jgi:membrane-associated phospholipid phosphatase
MDTSLPQIAVKKFTEVGDPTLLLLGGFGIFFFLWSHPDHRDLARGWAIALGLCIALTVAAKVALYLGDNPTHIVRLRSPSGHVAIATTFYGSCAMLLSSNKGKATRLLAGIGTALLLCGLAGSRVALGLHSLAEIMVGFAIGTFCLVVFAHRLHWGSPLINPGQLIALLFLLAVTRFARIDAESMIAYSTKSMMVFTTMDSDSP